MISCISLFKFEYLPMSFLTNGLLAHTTKRHPLYCLFLPVLNYTDFILMDR